MTDTLRLVLRLEGPLQSWGVTGRAEHRTTALQPSKSGVIGLVAAALGIERGDDSTVEELATLRMWVRTDRSGTVVSDFATSVHNGPKPTRRLPKYGVQDNQVIHRDFLADASFLVVLDGSAELVARCASALHSPVFGPVLGRRSCPPAPSVEHAMETPVLVCVDTRSAADIINDRSSLPRRHDALHRIRVVRDIEPSESGQLTAEVPTGTSPENRSFTLRATTTSLMDDLDGHDPFSLLEV